MLATRSVGFRERCDNFVPKISKELDPRLGALASILDAQTGRYEVVRDVDAFDEYLAAKGDRADEEMLTEPVLGQILEKVLGFPTDDLWHEVFGQDVTLWGPTHLVLLTGGQLTIVCILGLLVEARAV